jgi:hypothetical protein
MVRRERPVRPDVGVVGGGDHGPGRGRAQLRRRLGRGAGETAVHGPDRARLGQRDEVVQLGLDARDAGGRRRQPPQGLLVHAVRRGDPDPLAVDEAEVDEGVRLGDVLVDLAVGKAGEPAVVTHDDDLRLRRPLGLGEAERGLRHRDRFPLGRRDHRDPTPTCTSRKRAPETP